jgi:predicted MFS family arabinose efflux permease
LADDGLPAQAHAGVYNRSFWLAYVANLTVVSANAINFRFAEFVQHLDGTEEDVGAISGYPLYVSLLVRFWLATAISRMGVGQLWRLSAMAYIVGNGSMLAIHHIGPAIYLARMLTVIAVAGVFACSLSHIQAQSPPHRRTEAIATLGSSGFLGMILGSQLVDALFRHLPATGSLFPVMFSTIATLGVVYLLIVARLTSSPVPFERQSSPAAWTLLRTYWPRVVLAASLLTGAGFAVTTVFLTRFASSRHVGIKTFFTTYAASAFTIRLLSRNWHIRAGRYRMIALGLAAHAVSHMLLATVEDAREWQFVLPALCGGFGHAVVYPCLVSLGAGGFPPQYRGAGTTLTLGFIDLGIAVSAPLMGMLIEQFSFPTMFHASAAATAIVAVMYAFIAHRWPDAGHDHPGLEEEGSEVSGATTILE